jgi:hypothetical protein
MIILSVCIGAVIINPCVYGSYHQEPEGRKAMKTKNILLNLWLAGLCACFPGGGALAASREAYVTIIPGDSPVFSIVITSPVPYLAGEVGLLYDSSLIENPVVSKGFDFPDPDEGEVLLNMNATICHVEKPWTGALLIGWNFFDISGGGGDIIQQTVGSSHVVYVRFSVVEGAQGAAGAPLKLANCLTVSGVRTRNIITDADGRSVPLEEFEGITPFVRGDVNDDGAVNIVDAIAILDYLFAGGDMPPCLDAADIDDNGSLEITDPIIILRYLFADGPPPVFPFPNCGYDVTEDAISCGSYSSCH